LGTFFASKSQGGATPLPESVRGWRMSPRHPPVSAPASNYILQFNGKNSWHLKTALKQ